MFHFTFIRTNLILKITFVVIVIIIWQMINLKIFLWDSYFLNNTEAKKWNIFIQLISSVQVYNIVNTFKLYTILSKIRIHVYNVITEFFFRKL